MTADEVKSDLEVIEHLDFDPAFRCETRRPNECQQTAAFVMRFRCCGHAFMICPGHRAQIETEAAAAAVLEHRRCGAQVRYGHLAELVEFIPIGLPS